MPSRKCDADGKVRDMQGGKVCEKNGHFICKECIYSGFVIISERSTCPLDGSRLH